jgi:dihydroorotate dehydrogenase electron transfer subunit
MMPAQPIDSAVVSPRSVDSSTLPQRLALLIKSNCEVCPEYYHLEARVPGGIRLVVDPGQFFHISCDPARHGTGEGASALCSTAPLTLRRPFSAHRIHYAGFDRALLKSPREIPREWREASRHSISQIDFLYKVVGEGTRRLAALRAGDNLDVLGPLGRGFTPCTEKVAVIVGGGVGLAPLVALAEWLRCSDVQVCLYVGALTGQHLRSAARPECLIPRGLLEGAVGVVELIAAEFAEIGVSRVVVCTDDGSAGRKGRVSDVLAADVASGELPRTNVRFYACGPTPMMRSVGETARDLGAACEVLLEERMACGIGACWSCVCRKKDQDGRVQVARICVDGPVFEASSVCW